MIAFDLECAKGHKFEGWFDNNQSFEEQDEKKMISCPSCNDTEIRKVISPVATRTSSLPQEEKDVHSIDYPRLAKEVVEYIDKNFEELGSDFTKEALKIHYGVAEKRNIKGSATAEEEKMLKDEGIVFFKIPVPKIDDKKKN